MTQRIDIAIGPVQGFVAQSRRTRDLWGSSYLLSFLAGHAMQGAEKAGGRIAQPVVKDDRFYQWIGGERSGEPPRTGSLPNRFAVEVETEAESIARIAEVALRSAWIRVCDAVWDEFVANACELGADTQTIWHRQINAFWEVVWTAGPVQERLLARRKYWRSQIPPTEPGDKCTVMHDLQELSGHIRSANNGGKCRQDRFWEHVRKRANTLNLRDDERLCAIALIKRLFPRVSEKALGWKGEWQHWPSTVHIAARPWLRLVETSSPDLARDYADQVKRFAPSGILTESWSPGSGPGKSAANDFHRLDANWFHKEAVANKRLCPSGDDAEGDGRNTLIKALGTISHSRSKDQDGRCLGSPSSFYALLLADGDGLGKLVSETGSDFVSQALADFMKQAPKVVDKHGGETVYAGGDDVLAMLPVPDALRCADQLAESYRSSFGQKVGATLSASVLFVHIRYRLGSAIRDAHRLLDDVAKDRNGRNSLAVGVLKPGGLNSQWVTTWHRRDQADGCPKSSVELVQTLTDSFENEASEPGMSSALLYRIRELLARLGGGGSWQPGSWWTLPESIDLPVLLRAEIGHSLVVRQGENDKERITRMANLVQRLLRHAPMSADGHRNETGEGAIKVGIDALLLARFLAKDGLTEHET